MINKSGINKRGFEADIFKWILSGVIGAFVIVFFVRFAYQEIGLREKLNYREIIKNLDFQLEAFSVSDSSSKILGYKQDVEMEFSCDGVRSGDFFMKNNRVIFAHNEFNDDKLLIWTKVWEFPFKVENFFYLSGKQDRYLLVYDDLSKDFVIGLNIPGIFNLQKIHKRDTNSNLNSLKGVKEIVFFTNADLDLVRNLAARYLEIDLNNKKIKFDNGNEEIYFGDEVLIGAIFSDDYECVKEKVLKELKEMMDIYNGKISLMKAKELRERCLGLLSNGEILIRQYRNEDGIMLYNFRDKLNEVNNELRRNDCGAIF